MKDPRNVEKWLDLNASLFLPSSLERARNFFAAVIKPALINTPELTVVPVFHQPYRTPEERTRNPKELFHVSFRLQIGKFGSDDLNYSTTVEFDDLLDPKYSLPGSNEDVVSMPTRPTPEEPLNEVRWRPMSFVDMEYVDPTPENFSRRTFPSKEACDEYCERMMIDRGTFTDADIVGE